MTVLDAQELLDPERFRLTYARLAQLHEGVIVAMVLHHHPSGVSISMEGLSTAPATLIWVEQTLTPAMQAAWADPRELVEAAATGVAFLLIRARTVYTIIRRSWQGSGIDFWLGFADDPTYTNRAGLEVSGMHTATRSRFNERIKRKREQVRASADLGIPLYVVVFVCDQPRAYLDREEPT